jgi:hypothetical protein
MDTIYAPSEWCPPNRGRINGHFGDGSEHGPYNPYDVIRDSALSPFERTGVSIAILVYLATAVDNGTYESAVADEGRRLRRVLADKLLDSEPIVRSAAEAFLDSESRFLLALRQVFDELVLPNVVDPHSA